MKLSHRITHEEIARRAREIWDQTGQPDGYETEHWLQAERELLEQSDRKDEGQIKSAAAEAKPNRGSPRKVSKR